MVRLSHSLLDGLNVFVECEYFWVFFQKLNNKKTFYFAPLIPSVLVLGLSVCPLLCGSPWWTHTAPREYWAVALNISFPGNIAILWWLTRTEKAPERPELPLLDSCTFIPLLALITWRWNKKIVSLLLLLQQTLLSSGMTLKFSPAKVLTSCRC